MEVKRLALRALVAVLMAALSATALARAVGTATARANQRSGTSRAVNSQRYESVLFWLAWDGGNLATLPWKAVTQVDLFSLVTCVKVDNPAGDCTGPASLSANFNDVHNVRSFVSQVHRHGKLALISIGGSTNPNWYYPCSRANVAAFGHNLVHYMKSNGFDGIDLDIEQDAGTGHPAMTAADLRACTQTVSRDAKAVKTSLGRTPLVTSDVDPTTDYDIGRLQNPYVDQFNAMSYGAKGQALASQITALESQSRIPASKITAGLDIDDYPPPQTDCASTAKYASAKHLAGAMLWFGQADAPAYSCLHAIAPYVG
jgi:GH18 family chitinase